MAELKAKGRRVDLCIGGLTGPIALGLAVLVGLQIAYGTGVADALLYLAFLAGFVVLPGCAAYLALAPGTFRPLRTLAFGWALGYALLILAFMLTAALGTRSALLIYPLVVIAAALPRLKRQLAFDHTGPSIPRTSQSVGLFKWALVGVAAIAMAYFGVAYFVQTPLPGDSAVNYFLDYVWHLSLAAEFKHHWPIGDPHAVGAPQVYHYFVHIQMAAASQVTGIDLPLIFFRLAPLPLIALVVLLMAETGRTIFRSAWVGLIAAVLLLLVGNLQTDPSSSPLNTFPFLGITFSLLFLSPSFLFSLVLFIPLVVLIAERISSPEQPGGLREWILLALFAVGTVNAKVTLLPLTLAGLALFGVWHWRNSDRIPRSLPLVAGLLGLVGAVFYFLLYAGHGSGLTIDPFVSFRQMPAIFAMKAELLGWLPDFPGRETGLVIFGIVFGFIGLLGAQLVGLLWFIRRRGLTLSADEAWLTSLLLAGLSSLALLGAPGAGSQLYFVFPALIPGTLLAAAGLTWAWSERPSLEAIKRPLAAFGVAGFLLLAAIVLVPTALDLFPGPDDIGKSQLIRYSALGILVVGTYVIGRRLFTTDWPGAALATLLLITAGALSSPVSFVVPGLRHGTVEIVNGKRMTPEIHGALTWMRDNVPFDQNFAVNNDDLAQFNYTAFSEHRAYIEGWLYSSKSTDVGFIDVQAGAANPFADRLVVNALALADADATALATIRDDFDVRFLIIDSINGFPVDLNGLTKQFETVYEADGIRILKMGL